MRAFGMVSRSIKQLTAGGTKMTDLKNEVVKKFLEQIQKEIEQREDSLPYVLNPQEREKILQEIEELGLMSDQANERAEEIIAQYESRQPKSKDG